MQVAVIGADIAGIAGIASVWHPGDEDTPFIRGTPVKGVFVNAGHGPLGWTLACGGGKLVADPISAGPTDLCPSPFALARPS